jgi:hypothetical protein
MEMAEKQHGQQNGRVRAQLGLPYTSAAARQLWQSGRSRRRSTGSARHPASTSIFPNGIS